MLYRHTDLFGPNRRQAGAERGSQLSFDHHACGTGGESGTELPRPDVGANEHHLYPIDLPSQLLQLTRHRLRQRSLYLEDDQGGNCVGVEQLLGCIEQCELEPLFFEDCTDALVSPNYERQTRVRYASQNPGR